MQIGVILSDVNKSYKFFMMSVNLRKQFNIRLG